MVSAPRPETAQIIVGDDGGVWPRHVVVCVYNNINLFSLTAPLHSFSMLRRVPETAAADLYRTHVVSANGGLIMTSAGIEIMTEPFAAVEGIEIDTLVVPGGSGVSSPDNIRQAVHWIRRRAPTARRVCANGAGTFLLAAARLLEGRRAVSHWDTHAQLERFYPQILLQKEAIFVQDGPYWTAAGGSAGIDMALRLIQNDLGHRMAMEVARYLVIYLKRSGEEPQLSPVLSVQSGDEGRFERLNGWISANLGADLRLDALAQRAGMSLRNFSRAYALATGVTPAHAVEAMRLEAARRQLADTDDTVVQIAMRCGFGDDERMRRVFLRRIGVSPRDYRNHVRALA